MKKYTIRVFRKHGVASEVYIAANSIGTALKWVAENWDCKALVPDSEPIELHPIEKIDIEVSEDIQVING